MEHAAVSRYTPIVTGDSDVRWKQRFENFDRAVGLLDEALSGGPSSLSLLEKEGVIQRFEYSFELAWKTLNDYLEAEGLTITPLTPRQVLKDAFRAGIIVDGQTWIHMLDHRNLLSHSYDSSVFEQAVVAWNPSWTILPDGSVRLQPAESS